MSTTATKTSTGHIFLSHSGADTEAAHQLAETLRHNGLEIWVDKDDLKPGEHWMSTLERNIESASAMLVYVGRLGVQNWVDREVRLGLVRNTQDPDAFRLIPVLGEGADPESLPPFLLQQQWVDLRDRERAPEQIGRIVEVLKGGFNAQVPAAIPADYWSTHSPFRSLQVFEPEDSWLFFGRDADTDELLSRLNRASVLVLVGNSGSGKSSLVRAGLIPALQRGRFRSQGVWVTSWQIAVFRPSQSPFDYLADILPGQLAPNLSPAERDQFIGRLRSMLPSNVDALRNAILALSNSTNEKTHILLVVDQFEELFTLTGDRDEEMRNNYIQLLLRASRRGGIHLVLSLRADFYSHCLEYPELSRCLETNLYNVQRMSTEQLRETIEKRLALTGAKVESGLIDSLLSDVGNEPGDLALMEHALGQLWVQRDVDNTLTTQAYAEMGRLRGALGRHADDVYRQLGDQRKQLIVQRIFLELVQLGDGTVDTRRRVAKERLLSLGSSEQLEQLLTYLASSRLLQISVDGGQNFVEVSHESLIREWPALRRWVADNREELRVERRLIDIAEEWQKLNRDFSALLQGPRLAQAEEWLDKYKQHGVADPLVQEFVEASTNARDKSALRERELQERTRRSEIRFRGTSFALTIMLLFNFVSQFTEEQGIYLHVHDPKLIWFSFAAAGLTMVFLGDKLPYLGHIILSLLRRRSFELDRRQVWISAATNILVWSFIVLFLNTAHVHLPLRGLSYIELNPVSLLLAFILPIWDCGGWSMGHWPRAGIVCGLL